MDDTKKKVIDGLERHMHGLCHDTKDNLCPYWSVETGCSKALISDTLTVIRSHEAEIKKLNKVIEEKQKHLENLQKVNEELEERLKAQQPRLLTLWEVSNAKYPKDVFCEIKDENRVFAVTAPVPIHWRAQPDIRYWTARPTNEQSKAEPWKDGGQE